MDNWSATSLNKDPLIEIHKKTTTNIIDKYIHTFPVHTPFQQNSFYQSNIATFRPRKGIHPSFLLRKNNAMYLTTI
jgi:hypothetical protein